MNHSIIYGDTSEGHAVFMNRCQIPKVYLRFQPSAALHDWLFVYWSDPKSARIGATSIDIILYKPSAQCECPLYKMFQFSHAWTDVPPISECFSTAPWAQDGK